VIALAEAIAAWPEFELRVCLKLVGSEDIRDDLRIMTSSLVAPVSFVRRGTKELLEQIRWADLVHGQNASPDIAIPSRVLGKKVVLSIHNWLRPDLNLHSVLWRLSARLAHRRWYNSRFVWNTWEPTGKRSGSDCVPTICRLPAPAGASADAERRGFLFVGRWIENKGLDDLVHAYAAAGLDTERWPLILLGDGPLRRRINGLVAELGIRGVRMPGFVDDRTKAAWFARARWLVAPPRTREDLGLTPIEARNAGLPVIITRDGGLPDAAGDSALLAEPGDVRSLIECLRKAAAMTEAEYSYRACRGRETLRDFLRPMTFYRASYHELLGIHCTGDVRSLDYDVP